MSDQREKEAGKLILGNFQMFNEAVLHFEQVVQPAILKELDETIEHECKEELKGFFDFHEDEDNRSTKFFMENWLLQDSEEKAFAYFILDYSGESMEGIYALDDLCGINGGMGFSFCVEHGEFSGKNAWNKFYRIQCADVAQALMAKGFIDCKNGVFFLPFRLDAALLADAWENENYAPLMQPVVDAMQTLKSALPMFQEMLNRAKKEFNT